MLHKVNVRVTAVDERWDFVEVMWKNKKIYSHYSWEPFESSEEMLTTSLERQIDYLESDIEKYSVFEKYGYNHYVEGKEVEKFFAPLKVDQESVGNSDALAIILGLTGVYEQKDWLHSEQKNVITGNIDEHGKVLPVGSLSLKALAAEDENADLFIVPKEQYEEVFELVGKRTKMEVVPVETVSETIEYLDQL